MSLNLHPLIAVTKTDLDQRFEQYMAEIHPAVKHNSKEFAARAECFAAAQLILIQYQDEHPNTPIGILIPVVGIRARQAYNSAQKRFSNGTDNPE